MKLNLLKQKQEPIYHFEFGSGELKSFIVDFYFQEDKPEKCYLEISTISGIFNFKLQGFAYGYLLESARQGKKDNIHGFCAMLFIIASNVFSDKGLADDLMRALTKYQNRLLKKGAEQAKQVTKKHDDNSSAVMNSIIERAQVSKNKKLGKKASEQERKAVREVLDEIYKQANTDSNAEQ